MIDSAIRPVLTVTRALDELDAHADRPDWVGRGPARRRAYNAKNRLPPGALDAARAAEIAARWRRHFEDDLPAPEATGAPPAETGTTYWLSSGDADGAVLRSRLEPLPPRRTPWTDFFPCPADAAAEAAAEDAARRAATLLRFHPSEPLRGWHRAVPAEGANEAWRALRIEGRSVAAPIALMLLSRWLEKPLDPTLAVTGDLDSELRLVLPGDSRGAVLAKLRAVHRERACVRTVFVPRGAGPAAGHAHLEVIEIDGLEELAERFGLRVGDASPRPISVQGWMQAVDEAEWLIRARAVDLATMRARLERLDEVLVAVVDAEWSQAGVSPRAVDATKLLLLGRLAGSYAHNLDAPRSHDVLARIDALVEASSSRGRPLPLSTLATVRNVQASVMIDAHRFVSARTYAEEALAAATTAQDGVQAARIAGTRGRIEAHARDDARAKDLQEQALAALEENIPWETNLAACYLVGTLARLGHFDDAWATLAAARTRAKTAPGVTTGWREENLLYLDYEELKLALREGFGGRAVEAMLQCDARLAARSRGIWPAAGILVRGVEALLLADDLPAAEARAERLVVLAEKNHAPHLAMEIGRAAAALAVRALLAGEPLSAAHLTRIDAWLRAIPDGEENPLRAPRDASRALLADVKADPRDAARALEALLATEIY